jgi:P2-related tail formation protein
MATDLGVNGIGGLAQATTEQERRDVLLNAVRTRRRAGTVFALKRAIETLGYSTPTILEGIGNEPIVYDGTYTYDGDITYSGGNNGWAQFMVILPESELVGLTQSQIDLLVQYINYHKNERSELVGVGYYGTQVPLYDGQFNYDGTADYNGLPTQTIIFVYP